MLELLLQARALLEQEIAAAGPHVILDAKETPLKSSSPDPRQDMPTPAESELAASPSEGLAGAGGSAERDRFSALIAPDSPVLRLHTLEQVAEYVTNTPLIEIDHTRTNAVVGVGNPEADLMVIGEAPGADEDLKGEPFVGRAGQLLDKILEATGFSRDSVYIANILKSRPPKNRDPRPDEIEAHVPILYRQISLIRPKMILTVGRISACVLLGQPASLASMRGKLHDFHGIPLVVTYHPAALLRNPQWKRPTWEDMKFLRMHFDRLQSAA